MSRESSVGGGAGGLTLLSILFIGLKLTHFIDWRWRWVLAPVWGPAAIVVAVIVMWIVAEQAKRMLRS